MVDLQTPPTEVEIAKVIRALNVAGLGFMATHVRRLVYQRDALKVEIERLRHKLRTRKKVTVAQVREIRRRYAGGAGATMRSLAAEYGIANQTVSDIVHQHTWMDV